MAASLRAEERQLLEAATKQRSEVSEITSLCVIVICKV
jgi:hypothetical protein